MTRLRKIPVVVTCAILLIGCNPEEPVTDSQSAFEAESQSETVVYSPAPAPDIKVGQRPPSDTDEAGIWLMVDRSEKRTQTSGNRVKDPALNQYLKSVMCDLAGPYCPDVRVYIARVPHFNATMSPNGMMVVWTGLLLRVRNEAQLAAVLGHEIGHYLRRHSIQRFRRIRDTYGALAFMSMGMAIVGIPLITDIAALAVQGSLSAFSREHESEADSIGLNRIAEAGYDPLEAARVWQYIVEESDHSDKVRRFSFFLSTHPRPEDRQQELEHRAKEIVGKSPNSPRLNHTERFRAAIAPWRDRLLRDEVRLRDYKRSLGLMDMLITDGFRVGELRYFKGELYRLRDDQKKNDRKAAMDEYEASLRLGGYPVDIHKSIGLLKLRTNERAQATVSFRKYLELRPNAPERDYILSLITPSNGS
jgi:beta-barrel assembly-enhancing protease